MTESEWLTSDDPQRMLNYLTHGWRVGTSGHGANLPTPSDRKLRLFATGCCRQVWDQFRDSVCGTCEGAGWVWVSMEDRDTCIECGGTSRVNRSHRAVEVAERYADGLATDKALRAAFDNPPNQPFTRTIQAVTAMVLPNFRQEAGVYMEADLNLAATTQASLLRDIFGNPWSKPLGVKKWLGFTTATVVSIAQAIYAERAFDRMPILGDALEDAGCTDERILGHCRGEGKWAPIPGKPKWIEFGNRSHVRGCWVIDLVLGKE